MRLIVKLYKIFYIMRFNILNLKSSIIISILLNFSIFNIDL